MSAPLLLAQVKVASLPLTLRRASSRGPAVESVVALEVEAHPAAQREPSTIAPCMGLLRESFSVPSSAHSSPLTAALPLPPPAGG